MRKRFISLVLTALIVNSFSPITAKATVQGEGGKLKIENFNPSLKKMSPLVGSDFYVINLGDGYALTSTIAVGTINYPVINNPDKGGREKTILDVNALTVEECLKFAEQFNAVDQGELKLEGGWSGVDEIAKWAVVGYKDKGDASTAAAIRDIFISLAKSKIDASGGDATQVAILKTSLEKYISTSTEDGKTVYKASDEFTPFTPIATSNTGCKSIEALYEWSAKKLGDMANTQSGVANTETVVALSNLDFDKADKTYQRLITVRILTAETEFSNDLSSAFLKKAKSKYKDVVEKEIVENKDKSESITLLNKVLTDALTDSEDAPKRDFKALMSCVLERGSKYSYGSGAKVDTDDETVKAALISGEGNANADKGVEDALKSMKQILDSNPSITDNDSKLYLTMPQRVRYGVYLMQATDAVSTVIDNYKDLDTLSRTASEKHTIGSEPYILEAPTQLTHFEGYVYLNNISNDIDRLSRVLLPITLKIKATEDAGDSQLQLAQLNAVEEAYNVMTNPFQLKWLNKKAVDGKYSTSNPEALSPIEESWNKKIEVKIENDTVTTSLADEYARLKQLGVAFPSMEELSTSAEHPLNKDYFDLDKKQLSAPIRVGAALSSSFIPFKTNMYNPVTYRQVKDDDEFFKFHAIYGNYRKALYIDTDIASVSKLRTTGKVGSLKVATLKDVLQCEKDITLYTDDNFYNSNKLKEYKSEVNSYFHTDEKSDSTWAEKIKNAFAVNLEDALKTGDKTKYSARLDGVSSYSDTKQPSYKPKVDSAESILLNGTDIDSYLSIDNQKDASYNVMRAYSAVSSVYRDKSLYDFIDSIGMAPVFMSSKNLASTKGATQIWEDTYFNYALLKNIEGSMNVNYKSNLDVNKPVYMDIYGNILTESGDVIIPAAANSTLNNTYCPYTAAFITTYGTAFKIPSTLDFVSNSGAAQVMEKDEDTATWVFSQKSLNSSVDMNFLSTASQTAMDTLFNEYANYIKQGALDFDRYVSNIVLEVMRGAPIESINKSDEGLLTKGGATKFGIARAVQLDELKKSISAVGQNAILALPNLAFMDGIEYVIFFIYRLTLVMVAGLLLVQIYSAAMDKGFGIADWFKTAVTVAAVIGALYAIPFLFNLSYYEVNKAFLQKEALRTSMLNLEKEEAGVEVGMLDTGEPNISSKVYLKLKKVYIPWYDGVWDIASSNISATMSKIYEEYAAKDLAFGQKDFEFKNGYLYLDVANLYGSSTVTFNTNYNSLYAVSKDSTPASFYTPYYAFLHALCVDINTYNKENNVYAYTTQVYGGGRVKSLGLIRAYLLSDEFIVGTDDEEVKELTTDIMHLRELYKTQSTLSDFTIFAEDEIKTMQQSNWFNNNLTEEQVSERVAKLNKHAKKFVLANRDLIGRISDETFLKAMALDTANYYNNIFSIGSADGLEIYNLSADDLTRMAIASPSDVITQSPLSYSRFILEEAGVPGVYAAALLEGVNLISGWMKPILTLFIYGVIFISLFFYKIVLRKKTDSNKGYVYLVALLCLTNVIYAALLKVFGLLPRISAPALMCLIIQCMLQVVVVAIYVWLTCIVIANWRDLGSAKFSMEADNLLYRLMHGKLGRLLSIDSMGGNPGLQKVKDLIGKRKTRVYKSIDNYDDYDTAYEFDNDNYYDRRNNSTDNFSDSRYETRESKYRRSREKYENSINRNRTDTSRDSNNVNEDQFNTKHTKFKRRN